MQNGTAVKYYAGIGARKVSADVLAEIDKLALLFAGARYVLRSGGAAGCDSAWQNGSQNNYTLYLAEHATNAAIEMASRFHPNWKACNSHVCKLHGRNMMILLGPQLNDPVDFVCCWTPSGRAVGGTGQALRAAEFFGIPIFNLGRGDAPDLRSIKQCSDEMFKLKSLCNTTINRSNMR